MLSPAQSASKKPRSRASGGNVGDDQTDEREHEEDLLNIEAINNANRANRKKAMQKNKSAVGNQRPDGVPREEEIEEILKSYSLKNFKQSIYGILNNQEHADKITHNYEYLK